MLTQEQKDAEFERRKKKFKEYLLSPEYQEKLKKRLEITAACQKSAKARGITWQLCARPDNPAEGAIFFIENFGWSLDPRPEHEPHHLPFILFEYQKRAIKWLVEHIDNGRDGLVEKSRDMGASWLIFVMVAFWYWLFRDGTNMLLGSYKESLVDDKTTDSLFGKIDYLMDTLPDWIFPKGFDRNKHRTKLKLINPETGNQVTGDTMNPNFGRGSRKTVVMFDELGFWDYAEDSWNSCGDSTSCRIANSTPNGYDFYAHLRHKSGIDVLTLHWTEHPHKDQGWYEFECHRRSEEEVAQELDISYSKSRKGRVYPEWTENNVKKGRYGYDDSLPLYVSWDFGKSDDTAIIWAQPEYDGGIRVIDVYRNNGKNIEFYVPIITGIRTSQGYEYNEEELEMMDIHKEWKPATHFGDPSGRFVNQVSDETVISVLKNWGIIVNFKERWKYFNLRRPAAKDLIQSGVHLNEVGERMTLFDMRMTNASYPKSKVEGMDVYRTEKPKHDDTSHYRTSFEYLAMGLEDFRPTRKQPYDKFQKVDPKLQPRKPRKAVRY